MRKKLIGMLICGIFFMTSYSSLSTNTKAEFDTGITQTEKTFFENNEESTLELWKINLYFGFFYSDGSYVLGDASLIIIIELKPSLKINFQRDTSIRLLIDDPNFNWLVQRVKLLIFIQSE